MPCLWCFYLSAGTAEQGEASNVGNPWRRGEWFVNADGNCHWIKVAGQQWLIKAARDRGVERFLTFPNAVPVHFSSDCAFPAVEWCGWIHYPQNLELKWETPQRINKVVPYDRPTLDEQLAACVLTFSDGSKVDVYAIYEVGGAHYDRVIIDRGQRYGRGGTFVELSKMKM